MGATLWRQQTGHGCGRSVRRAPRLGGHGINRYDHESKSEFREWSLDIPIEYAGNLLTRWRERNQNSVFNAVMDAFIRDRCPNWARYLLRTGGRC